MKSSIYIAGALLTGIAVSGCGAFSKKDGSSNDDGPAFSQPANSGCVQGVVLNGLTGERIRLSQSDNANETQGVSILVHNHLMQASPMVKDDADANANLVGEYSLCGFPLDETFPIFAWVDGYESFEGLISVDSTVAQRTPNSREVDIARSNPTLLANIRLFPKGTETRDLKFVVSHGDQKVLGAQVQLRATGANILSGEGTIAPQIRLVPQIATTNSAGEVIFKASDLVLGGIYEYVILPPEGGDRLSLAKGVASVGLRAAGTGLTDLPYEVKVNLGSSRQETPNPTPNPVDPDTTEPN